ncbi:hypothetical protein CLV97_12445 [Planifilum fimeticola]|uniref:Uncharacterized protein n=1 Tax=Planifilum fimeticola TaxID=201975 RepID=A0A2T0LC30_9BACL|nr:hypothetical protein [Planifilum fimeticola]PRX39507.1 hypothetical protein CLV97_12445 [Planifilum fimeticola]
MHRIRQAMEPGMFAVLVSDKKHGPFRLLGFYEQSEVEKALSTYEENGHIVFMDPAKIGYLVLSPEDIIVAEVRERLMHAEEADKVEKPKKPLGIRYPDKPPVRG